MEKRDVWFQQFFNDEHHMSCFKTVGSYTPHMIEYYGVLIYLLLTICDLSTQFLFGKRSNQKFCTKYMFSVFLGQSVYFVLILLTTCACIPTAFR